MSDMEVPLYKKEYRLDLALKEGFLDNGEIDTLERREETVIQNYFSLNTANLLKLVGDTGNYQKMIFIISSIYGIVSCFIAYQFPFIFTKPTFLCKYEGGKSSVCSEQEACTNELGFELEFTRKSLSTDYNLYCDKRTWETSAKSLIFLFAGPFSLFFSIFSDYLGRRPILVFSNILILIGCAMSYISDSYDVIVAGMVLTLGALDLFCSMLYIYLNEAVGSHMRSMGNGVYTLFLGIGGMIFVFINLWITDYRTVFMLQIVGSVITLLTLVFVCESPFFLFKQMNIKKLYIELKYICFINHQNEGDRSRVIGELDNTLLSKEGDDLVLPKMRRCKIVKTEKKEKFSFSEYLSHFTKRSVINLIMYSIVLSNVYLGYSLCLLVPAKLGLNNMYINGEITWVSETIGYLIGTLAANKLKRRQLNLFYIISTIFIAVFLILIQVIGLKEHLLGKVLETVISFVMILIMAVSMTIGFTYGPELFPTKIRGFSTGVGLMSARMMASIAAQFEALSDTYNFHPLITTCFFSVIAFPCAYLLPETLNKQMID